MSIKAALKAQLRHLQKQTAAAGAAEKSASLLKTKGFVNAAFRLEFASSSVPPYIKGEMQAEKWRPTKKAFDCPCVIVSCRQFQANLRNKSQMSKQ